MKKWCKYLGLSVVMFLIYMAASLSLGMAMYLPSGMMRNSMALLGILLPLWLLGGWSYVLGLWHTSWRVSQRECLILLAIFVVMEVWVGGLGLLKSGRTDNDKTIRLLFYVFPVWLMLFYTCVLAPVCEEILFRGVIMGKLPLTNPWWGIALSSLLFAAVHVPEDWLAWLMYGGMGLAFAFTFYRTKSLVPCLILHVANNILGVVLLLSDTP